MKKFNTTGACFPDRHYMVQLGGRLAQMKQLVDDENYCKNVCKKNEIRATALIKGAGHFSGTASAGL